MSKSKYLFSKALALTLVAGPVMAQEGPKIGIVNFSTCISDSKYGQKEQENFDTLRKQMSSLMENTEKELREITAKFEDTEYLDSLSPKAEEDLKVRYQALQEDLGRYQNQYYQVLNHANYQMVQKVTQTISSAAEKVAQSKQLDYVMNKDVCFYIRPDLDVTQFVIGEMDKTFELDAKGKKISDNSEESPQLQATDETLLDTAG